MSAPGPDATAVTLAPMSRRVVGALIDQVIVLCPVLLGAIGLGYRTGHHLTSASLLAVNAAILGVCFVYETVMVALTGRTVGKMLMGTRVVTLDGRRPGWVASAQRSVLPLLCGTIPSIGLLLGAVVYGLALFHPLRQGLHDRAAGTMVLLAQPAMAA